MCEPASCDPGSSPARGKIIETLHDMKLWIVYVLGQTGTRACICGRMSYQEMNGHMYHSTSSAKQCFRRPSLDCRKWLPLAILAPPARSWWSSLICRRSCRTRSRRCCRRRWRSKFRRRGRRCGRIWNKKKNSLNSAGMVTGMIMAASTKYVNSDSHFTKSGRKTVTVLEFS